MAESHAYLAAVVIMGALLVILISLFTSWTACRRLKRRKNRKSGLTPCSDSSERAGRFSAKFSATADSVLTGERLARGTSGDVDAQGQASGLLQNKASMKSSQGRNASGNGDVQSAEDCNQTTSEEESTEIQALLKAGTQSQHSSVPARQSRESRDGITRDSILDEGLHLQLCGIVNDVSHAFQMPLPKKTA